MSPLFALYPYILHHFPKVPETAIDRAIIDGAIQFAKDSLVWQEQVSAIILDPAQLEYPIVPLSDAYPYRVVSAKFNGDRDFTDDGKLPFSQTTPDVVEFSRVPDGATTLTLKAALRPKDDATVLPDMLISEWREAIVAAALFRLHLAYGDPAQAATAEALYLTGMRTARAQAQVGAGRGRRRTRGY